MNALITPVRPGPALRLPAPVTLARPKAEAPGLHDLLFKDWLSAHRDSLFRWTMLRVSALGRRRIFAATAVAVQRVRGVSGLDAWLFEAAVQSALSARVLPGGLPESALAGLAPELRTLLRLISRGDLRAEEAKSLPCQRVAQVRCRLLQARLEPARARH